MPQISVIVPVYKVEPYLRRCVDSILGQTFTDFELILVDDGSPDNCPAICDEYAAKDSRVHVIHQENSGLSAARNAGIDWAFANSNSQWLSFVDSDDWVHPQYLERLLNAALEHSVAVSICGYAQTEGEEPEISLEDFTPQLWDTAEFYVKNNVNATIACGKLYQKPCFETIRYPLGKLHEDEFTTYQILFQNETLVFVTAPLYSYFQNRNSIMHSEWKPERLSRLDAYVERIAYFQRAGNFQMYGWALSTYIWATIALCKQLQADQVNYPYADVVSKRLRTDLFYFRKDLPMEQFGGAYTFAFPKTMQIYWLFFAVKEKIKKGINTKKKA